ncbi:MAG: MBL fold metallo-hydrolase [Clostridia bacterium]|nr:MBL fold metallo-hydrolase [Clostridia bacterium]
MNKKSKIIVAIVITILLIILMIIGYTPSYNETGNDEIAKIDIQIDNSKLNIFYFYVGEADCTLIMNKGQVMLIDAGEDADGELIVQFLKKIRVTQIDYLIATHNDDDHIGGMKDIVNNFSIGKLYIPAKEADNKSYTDLTKIEGLELQNVEINQTGTIRRC